jgi:Kdo2-lipid IVA lauroyltransferase/acyltransferase
LRTILFKIIIIPLLYFISILPFPLLYAISSFFFLVVYYLIGYRKKVVMQNLRNAFPEKSAGEHHTIARKFYAHLCDVMFETVKLLTISRKTFKKRCRMDASSIEIFEEFFSKNQTIVGVMAHCGNWEWGAIAHQIYFKRMITGVYHPLSNKNFDALMLQLRSRFGGDIVAMNQLYKRLIKLKQQGISTTIGLIADQTPPPESAYWTTFLNQDTPVFNGTEKLARKFNYPVVYMGVKKVKRGYYDLRVEVITHSPNELPEGEISEIHTRKLEQDIREQPETWLWSHRRWKHRRTDVNATFSGN